MKDQLGRSVEVCCNAKINLFLKVGGRRPDGYHEIQTVYHSVSLADSVTVTLAEGGLTVSCDDDAVPRDGSNLAVRAAAAVLDTVSSRPAKALRPGLHIEIRKRIPIGAGLGGGSADAAGTLVAVSELCGLNLDTATMEALAATVGADVKFMLRGGCAVGRGRGDQLEALKPLPALPVLIVAPGITVSTSWAYDSLKIPLTTDIGRLTMVTSALEKGDIALLCDLLENDFEDLVLERFPAVKAIKDRLVGMGARGALMSGSGSAVYGIFSDVHDARASGEIFSLKGLRTFVADFAVRGVTTPQ